MVRRHLARLVIGRRQFDSKLVIGGHRLVTTPCDNERNVIYKTALITAHLDAEIILVVTSFFLFA